MKNFNAASGLFLLLVLLNVYIGSSKRIARGLQSSQEERLVFSVTYRDFLPGTCFFIYADQSNFTLQDQVKQPQLDAWNTSDSPTRINTCQLIEPAFFSDDDFFSQFNSGTPGQLALQPLLRDGVFSGHPDFETDGQVRVNSQQCSDVGIVPGVDFPVSSCIFELAENGTIIKNEARSIIKDELEVGTNGLAKPVYCSDAQGGETRCGFAELNNGDIGPIQTQKKFFDTWFNDDAVFNKRVGQNLVLKPVSESSALFVFDADNELDDPGFDTDEVLGHFGPLGRFTLFNDAIDIEEPGFDILDAPAWPRTIKDVATLADTENKTFYITTELHSTFEYRSDEEMFFEFSGDDDFWCFINNKLVIDLGGVHSRFDAAIDLNSDFNGLFNVAEHLGLVDGQTATIDIFHAERQTSESAFKITTSLFQACNVQQSGSLVIDTEEEQDINLLQLSPAAIYDQTTKEITLQQESSVFSSAFVFSKVQENVGRGFIVDFEVSISGPTEGFAFVIQAQGIDDFPAQAGPSFGLTGLTRSFGVVFDFCPNRASIANSSECAGQTVSVHRPDSGTEPNAFNLQTRRTFDSVVRNLKRSEYFPVQVVHYGGNPNFLEVYVNSSLYLRESDFNLSEVLQGSGGHVGIVATSSDVSADIKVRKFSVNTVEVEPSSTVFVNETAEPQEVIADGESVTDGFSVVSADFCGNQLEAGTLGFLFDARYIQVVDPEFVSAEEALVGRSLQEEDEEVELFVQDATIQDNGDGTYNVQLKTLVPGSYKLAVAFGEGCVIDVLNETEIVLVDGEEVEVDVLTPVLAEGSPENCFFSEFANGEVVAVAEPVDTSFNTTDVNENALDRVPLLIISGVASCCFLCVIVAIVLFVRKRKKWNDDKDFVAPGELFATELDTKFDNQNEYNVTGLQVLKTQQEILDLKTHAALNQRAKEISALKAENDTLKETLRASRMEAAVKDSGLQTIPSSQSQTGTEMEAALKANKKTEL